MKILNVDEARKSILLRRPLIDYELPDRLKDAIKSIFGKDLDARGVVLQIIDDVINDGDKALKDLTNRIDGVQMSNFKVQSDEFENAEFNTENDILVALKESITRVYRFHQQQPVNSWVTQELGGTLGQLIRPIERIGCYVPGGSAPLPSTVIMSIIPAIVAGVKQIVITTPPQKSGEVSTVILTAVQLIREQFPDIELSLYKVGGAQAIAAMAFGTQTIPKVDKIVGPGNIFVSIAKKEVFGVVGIDGIAGPTEAMILADESVNADLIAADLLAQAEHDPMAVPILVTTSLDFALLVNKCVEKQVADLSRSEIIKSSINNRGGIVLVDSIEQGIVIVNEFAPEHLSLAVKGYWDIIPKIHNAGGIFLGELSCEVLGDYIAGPSHVMPTGGSAKYASPLNILDFVKIVSLVGLDKSTVQKISTQAETIAQSEKLTAHAAAAKLRSQI